MGQCVRLLFLVGIGVATQGEAEIASCEIYVFYGMHTSIEKKKFFKDDNQFLRNALIDCCDLAVIVSSSWACCVLYFRVKDLLGYNCSDLINKSLFDYHHAMDSEVIDHSYRNCKYSIVWLPPCYGQWSHCKYSIVWLPPCYGQWSHRPVVSEL